MCIKTVLHWYPGVPSIFSSIQFYSWKSNEVSQTFFLTLSQKPFGRAATACWGHISARCWWGPPASPCNTNPTGSSSQVICLSASCAFSSNKRFYSGETVKSILCGFKFISVPSEVLHPEHIYDYLIPDCRDLFVRTCLKHWLYKRIHTCYTPIDMNDTIFANLNICFILNTLWSDRTRIEKHHCVNS